MGGAEKIVLILGPMWSGKTNELIRRYNLAKHGKKKCIAFKSSTDVREGHDPLRISSHSQQTMDAIVCSSLMSMAETALAADEIFIDEGQFTEDLTRFCLEMARAGKKVYVAALNGDFEQKMFPSIVELIPHARIKTLHAKCVICGQDTVYSHRLDSTVKDKILSGGHDKYDTRCLSCLK